MLASPGTPTPPAHRPSTPPLTAAVPGPGTPRGLRGPAGLLARVPRPGRAGLSFVTAKTGFLVGLTHHPPAQLYRTDDGGRTWRVLHVLRPLPPELLVLRSRGAKGRTGPGALPDAPREVWGGGEALDLRLFCFRGALIQ